MHQDYYVHRIDKTSRQVIAGPYHSFDEADQCRADMVKNDTCCEYTVEPPKPVAEDMVEPEPVVKVTPSESPTMGESVSAGLDTFKKNVKRAVANVKKAVQPKAEAKPQAATKPHAKKKR